MVFPIRQIFSVTFGFLSFQRFYIPANIGGPSTLYSRYMQIEISSKQAQAAEQKAMVCSMCSASSDIRFTISPVDESFLDFESIFSACRK